MAFKLVVTKWRYTVDEYPSEGEIYNACEGHYRPLSAFVDDSKSMFITTDDDIIGRLEKEFERAKRGYFSIDHDERVVHLHLCKDVKDSMEVARQIVQEAAALSYYTNRGYTI